MLLLELPKYGEAEVADLDRNRGVLGGLESPEESLPGELKCGEVDALKKVVDMEGESDESSGKPFAEGSDSRLWGERRCEPLEYVERAPLVTLRALRGPLRLLV